MKVALVVPRLTADIEVNLATLERLAADAAAAGVDLVLLPEAVLTGLINTDDPAHDLPLAQAIPGPATERLSMVCARHSIWLGFGMLEREESRLYDSAVLLRPDGSIALKYRRNQPQWHGKEANPEVYCQGEDLPMVRTPFAKVAFLICGDLFDDAIVSRFMSLGADWLLFPFARCFPDGTANQTRWDREELPAYAQQVRRAQTPALLVNYLADSSLPYDHSFGGACMISAEGEVLASLPLGEEGILIIEAQSVSEQDC